MRCVQPKRRSRLTSGLGGFLRRFARSEDGNSTIDFILYAPLAFMLFVCAYESGTLSTRHVMLERGVDVAVRKVRIGAIAQPTHENLKAEICQAAAIIPDCLNQVKLEMVIKDVRNWTDLPAEADCIDRAQVGAPMINFTTGGNNQLMVLRVCALFDPMMPTSTIGAAIPKESEGAYALVATSSFVLEPFRQ